MMWENLGECVEGNVPVAREEGVRLCIKKLPLCCCAEAGGIEDFRFELEQF